MSVDPGLGAARARSVYGRRLARVLGVVLAGVLVTLAILIAIPPAGLVKDRIGRIIGDEIGRTVTLGWARLAFRPDVHIELDDIAVANPAGMGGPDFFRAEKLKATIRLWPLLQGEADLVSLDLTKPELNLQEDASGRRNWLIERKSAAGERGGLALPHTATLDDGRVAYASAKTGTATAFDGITADAAIDRTTGAIRSKGRLAHKGETVAFDVALADMRALAAGRVTGVKASVEGRHAKAEISGQAVVAEARAFAGDLNASIASLVDLARWFGANVSPSAEPIRAKISGKIKTTPGNVQFLDTDVVVNETSAGFKGNLDIAGPRPRLEGEIEALRLDVARITGTARRQGILPALAAPAGGIEELVVTPAWESLLAEIKELEAGKTSRAAAEPAEALGAAPKAAWSEQPISLGAVKAIDADVLVTAREIVYGGLDLKNGVVRARIANGVLDAKVEKLDVGTGHAVGNVMIDTGASPPRTELTLTMTDVAAEPIVNEITGKPLLMGTSNVEIAVKALGQTPQQLASTVEGRAKFRMGKGALRGYEIHGFDFWEMLTNWKTILKFDLSKKTQFERIDAQYDIRKGIMTSAPGLDVGGSEVEINSKGDVNLPRKRITQKLRVTVLPPPTTFSLPVLITGEWAKPSIGIDWGTWFAGSTPSGDLRSLAPAVAAPPEVQAAIRRLLAQDIGPERLSEEGKAVLRALLAGAPDAEPAPGAGGEAPQ